MAITCEGAGQGSLSAAWMSVQLRWAWQSTGFPFMRWNQWKALQSDIKWLLGGLLTSASVLLMF